MMFMNFIISVIVHTYRTVADDSAAQDYKIIMSMVYERELIFKHDDFHNPNYFPNILIIRNKKANSTGTIDIEG